MSDPCCDNGAGLIFPGCVDDDGSDDASTATCLREPCWDSTGAAMALTEPCWDRGLLICSCGEEDEGEAVPRDCCEACCDSGLLGAGGGCVGGGI